MSDDHVLIEASREVRAALMMAQADENASEGRHAVMLNIAQLRAVSVALALNLAARHDPAAPKKPDLNPEGGRITDHPDFQKPAHPEPEPEQRDLPWPSPEAQGVWMHQITVKSAEAIPGIQALLFLRRGIKEVEVSPAGTSGERWQLKWRDTRDVDLDFLRPHIIPEKTKQPTWSKSGPGVLG